MLTRQFSLDRPLLLVAMCVCRAPQYTHPAPGKCALCDGAGYTATPFKTVVELQEHVAKLPKT